MTSWDFASADSIDISIDDWGTGSIAVAGEPTSAVTVEVVPSHRGADVDDLLAQVRVSFEDGHLYIQGPRAATFRRKKGLDLTIRAPEGSSCAAKTISADLSCVGDLSAVSLQTASGDLTAASVTDGVTVRSASGDVMLDNVGGTVSIHTASGDVQATRLDGDVRINSASGDIQIASCGGPVAIHTASGDVRLGAVGAGRVELLSASGDLQVGVLPGFGVYMDLSSHSGDIHSDLDASDGSEGDDESAAALRINCRTQSGDIRITKARGMAIEPAS
jgi:Putative adhesin